MLSCLEAVEKIVPSNIGVKRLWVGALVRLRKAVQLQKKVIPVNEETTQRREYQ